MLRLRFLWGIFLFLSSNYLIAQDGFYNQLIDYPIKTIIRKDLASQEAKGLLVKINQQMDSILRLNVQEQGELAKLSYQGQSKRDTFLIQSIRTGETSLDTLIKEHGSVLLDHPNNSVKALGTLCLQVAQQTQGQFLNSFDRLTPFVDNQNGRFLVNFRDSLIGRLPPSQSLYMDVFREVLADAKANSGKPVFVKYTFYDIVTDERTGDSYGWVLYQPDLQWLIGVVIDSNYYYKKLEELKNGGLLILLLFSILLAGLILFQFIRWRQLARAKKAIEKTNIENELYLKAADNASSYIALVDNKDTIRWSNKAFNQRYQKEHLIGQNFYAFTNHPQPEQLKKQLEEQRLGKDPTPISYPSKLGNRKTKSVISFFNAKSPNKNWFVIVDTDVQDLEDARQIQENMYRAISHDIKSPLMNAHSRLKRIRDRLPNYTVQKGDLDKITNNVFESYSIVENFRDSASYEMGFLDAAAEEVNLYELVNDSAILLAPFAKSNHAIILNEIDASLEVMVVKEMCETIFRNLITNSIKSIGQKTFEGQESGQIKISAQIWEETKIRIQVTDNGVGMSSEQASSLFVDANIRKGLGTYLIAYFHQHHGADLDIFAESVPGKGTNIYLDLPKH